MKENSQFPVFNEKTMAMLRKSTASNPLYLNELFENFMDDASELIAEMESAGEKDEFEQYYNSVHTLKGLCGTIGCSRMFEMLKFMDSLNKEQNFDQSKGHLSDLKNVFEETVHAIKTQIIGS